MTQATTTSPDWSAWSRTSVSGVDVRGAELPIDSADLRLRYNDVSTGAISVPFTPQAWNLVGRGTRVEVRRHRRTVLNGSVIDRELAVDPDNPGGVINVTVESDEGLLADRVCFPDPTLPFLSQTNGAAYRQTAPAETVAKDLVRLNAGPGALAERTVAGLAVEASTGRGITYESVLRYDNLLTAVQVLARDGGPFGFRVDSSDPAARVFRVFDPPDLSATVRFSLALGNLAGLKYAESAPTATYAMSEGVIPEIPEQTETTTNPDGTETVTVTQPYVPPVPLRYAETTTDPGSLDYSRRAEVWTDAGGSITGVTDLYGPVRDALGGGRAAVALTLDPSPDYLLDADPATLLGAVVTVQVGPLGYTDTLSVLDVVREVRLTYDLAAGADDVIPTVGSDGATASTLTPYLGDLNRRLSLLERR